MICVYHGKGSCDLSTNALIEQLSQSFSQIQKVDSHFLKTERWELSTSALIMGGGKCSTWEEELEQAGMEKIHEFVFKGGKFVGFCAGAYFSASYSRFSLLNGLLIEKRRPLKLFEGKAVGPLFPTDNPLGLESAKAVSIRLGKETGYCYYQGGCYFETEDQVEVLAHYANDRPAMIKKKSALLCGFHPEFSWENLGRYSDPIFGKLADTLSQQEPFRRKVWKKIVSHLQE